MQNPSLTRASLSRPHTLATASHPPSSSATPPCQQIDLNATFNEPMDCISLVHHDLNLCTNSAQYKLIMSLVNNLVLYFR
jgi:hypothetical protein